MSDVARIKGETKDEPATALQRQRRPAPSRPLPRRRGEEAEARASSRPNAAAAPNRTTAGVSKF